MAQIISFDKLVKLAKKPIAEAEGSSRFWHKAELEHSSMLKTLIKDQHVDERAALEKAYKLLKNGFLKDNCPPIEYINEGSSRAAFALDGGQCLKIAVNQAGVGQNKAEIENTRLSKGLDIFPKLYDYAKDFTMMLVECITPAKDDESEDWKIAKMFGIETCPRWFSPVDQLGQIVDFIVSDIRLQPEESMQVLYEDTDEEVWREIAGYVLKPSTVQQQMLRKLVLYAIEHHREFDPADIGNIQNWGFAIREGQICPIMLDAGFSEEVRDGWY